VKNRLFGTRVVGNTGRGEPVKVMYIIDSYIGPYAGTEKQLFYLASGLNRQEIHPHLTVFHPTPYIHGSEFPCAITILPIKRMLSMRSLLAVIRYGFRLRKEGFRLAHIYFVDASILMPVILRSCGIKVIISRRDMGYWYNALNTAILRFNSLFVNAVIANCNAVKERTHSVEWIPRNKIHVIYNGMRNVEEVIVPAPYTYDKDRVNVIVIGMVANIRKVKRIDDLIRAFSIICKRHPDASLLIVGSGDASDLMILAEKLGISQRITFTGAMQDTSRIIRAFDVAVSCSESEGLSNSIIEYMQNEIPVVCTRTGGNTELIENGETGFIVEVGDYANLAEKISLLLSDRVMARRMGSNAAKAVKELCDMKKMVSRHSDIYKSLINSSS
jgi:glycosyltransferase involved in cell wall biosynthesis